jgi:hypothetical protein
MNRQDLINAVLKQIETDFNYGDLTTIEELISNLDDEMLLQFLPEIEQEKLG